MFILHGDYEESSLLLLFASIMTHHGRLISIRERSSKSELLATLSPGKRDIKHEQSTTPVKMALPTSLAGGCLVGREFLVFLLPSTL